jgi:phospholipid/cholesterol/gamma-HCH transport system permease protein
MALRPAKPKQYLISRTIDAFFIDVHEIFRFMLQFFREVFVPPFEFRETIKQCYQVGYKTIPLISVTAFITGMVFTVHSRPALADFGATSWLPSLTGAAIMKALSPLITSLICAGKTGSQLGAEIGSMRVTEQIDAMEVSAINPFKFLVVTRVVATSLMLPVLTLYSAFIGLFGSFVDVYTKDQITVTAFIQDAFIKVGYPEMLSAVVRPIIFGFTIGIVGCYRGFTTTQGTEGVGRAANSAVVISMFLIFIEEIVAVKFFNAIFHTQ